MSHLRTQIRNKLKEVLNPIDLVEDRIYFDRLHAVPMDTLPCVLVSIKEEGVNREQIGMNSNMERILQVVIAIVVKDTSNEDQSNYQDVLDQILLDIEKKIALNKNLDNLVTYIRYTGSFTNDDEEHNEEIAILGANFEVKYRARENSPDIANP